MRQLSPKEGNDDDMGFCRGQLSRALHPDKNPDNADAGWVSAGVRTVDCPNGMRKMATLDTQSSSLLSSDQLEEDCVTQRRPRIRQSLDKLLCFRGSAPFLSRALNNYLLLAFCASSCK